MTTMMKAGRYEIIGELGRGAMGVVYKATDPVIGRTVAVKTIKLSEEGTGLTRPELLARFQTEARAAGLLTHPNIVVVFDAGEEAGLYYITMELVEGKSVQALLDAGHAFPLPRVLRIIEQTCNALQFAHERNIVHRDIKPANIMLTADDTVKVTDFGTAKILQFGTVQQTTHVMGTPSYMSPEQVKGRPVDGRSDIFSLGVMLYEMVTGEKPFPGQNITTVIYKIVNEDPVPPRQINPSVHPGISGVVMKALAKEPEARYQSCREMLEDLRNYRSAVAHPDSTMAGQAGANATMAMPLAGVHAGAPHRPEQVAAISRSLTARAGSPTQTPGIRRTGVHPPYEEPRKKSVVGTIFAALLLLGVIGYGAVKLRPVYEPLYKDVRQHPSSYAPFSKKAAPGISTDAVQQSPVTSTPSVASDPDSAADSSGSAQPDRQQMTAPVSAQPIANSGDAKPVEVKATQPPPPPAIAPAKKLESAALTAKAAEYKGRIEEAISERGLSGRLKVQGVGNTLVLSGKLRPAEHGGLLKFLHNAPSEVHVVDHIEYDDVAPPQPAVLPAVPPAAGSAAADPGARPVPSAGNGAIRVLANVPGATAVLRGPAGRVLNQCQTPCSFNELIPARYSLEVKKEGYRPVQTALQVKVGVSDQSLALEALATGLKIVSDPPGADVFINGAPQSGQTPVTLPLAAGEYNLVLRLPGYDAYANHVVVNENAQSQLNIKLNQRSMNHVAFAQVETFPKGAEIFVDGETTGKFSPARIELPVGIHTILLKLDGRKPVQRTVEASDGGTLNIREPLHEN